MSSFNGLKKIAATDIQNSGRFYLGNAVNAGTAGQALVSGGPNEPARWDIHTGTIQPLTMGANVSLASGNPDFDGSIPDTLNSVDTTYTAGNGIQISGSNIIQTKTDNQTIRDSGGGSGNQLEVIKVPNDLTFTGYATGTFNGSSALNINLVDTTYTAGTNLTLVGTTFNVNASLTGINSISFTNSSGTTLTGSNASGTPTTMTNFDLTDTSNIVSPYFLHDVYDPVLTDFDNLLTSFAFIFSSNLKNSFTAQKTSCCIELLIYNYSITGNRFLYLQLGDNAGNEWSVGTSGGGSGTGTRSTERTTFYTDETDKAQFIQTWYLQGLTVGTSYTINPMARTSATTNYIAAGGPYPACILRGYYV